MRDLLDAPGRGTEHERLADARLEHHLLVELADAARAAGRAGQEHAVEPPVRDGAGVGDGDARRTFPAAEPAGAAIPGDARRSSAKSSDG